MNQIWPIGTEIWFPTDKKCELMDGMVGWSHGRRQNYIPPISSGDKKKGSFSQGSARSFLRTPNPNSESGFGQVLSPNLPNQCSALSFLQTPKLPNQDAARSFLRTPNPNSESGFGRFFFQTPNCRTRVRSIPVSEPAQPGFSPVFSPNFEPANQGSARSFLRTPNLPNQD